MARNAEGEAMNEADKAALLNEIAASRKRLSTASASLHTATDGIRKKLNFPERIAGSYRRHRPAWLGGAALAGFVLSRLPARKKTVYVDEATGKRIGQAGKLGVLWGIVKFTANMAKPWLGNLAGERLADLAHRFTTKNHQTKPTEDTQ